MDTETAEERIKHDILVNHYIRDNTNPVYYYSAMGEYADIVAAPLKKRIEELEKALEHAKSILLIEKYAVAAKEIDVILNPSTNGKQD